MNIPIECIPFWQWIATGAFTVPLLEALKKIGWHNIGAWVDRHAWWLAMLLPTLASIVSQVAIEYCETIPPLVWLSAYAGIAYMLSQLFFRLGKQSGHIHD